MFCRLKFLFLVLGLVALSLFASSCGSSSAKIRFVQAIPDLTAGQPVDIYIDGNKAESSVGFGVASPGSNYLSTGAGTRHVQLFFAGQTNNAVFDGNVSLGSGTDYTLVFTGSFSSGTVVAPLLPDTNSPAPTAGNTSIRIIHASPYWNSSFYPQGMSIYVVAPNTNIVGVTPTVTALGYTKPSPYISAPAGSYDVIASPPTFAQEAIVGGPFSFNSGDIRTVIFIDAPGGHFYGSSPIVLNDLGN